jgi:hypothetical protein
MADNAESFLGVEAQPGSPPPRAVTAADTSHPLYGVKGWLKLLVVVNLYIVPILFALGQIGSWVSYTALAEKYPGIIFVGLLNTLVGGYLVVRTVRVAIGLRDLQPRAVQNAKTLLQLCLTWTFVSIPIAFVSGLDAEVLLPGIVKGALSGTLSFAIWYSYFNTSRRVEATYPDWKD